MCARTDGANEVRDAARCLTVACLDKTPITYRQHLNETLKEGVPAWARDLLGKLR